jgi:uncharacterized membrane protein
MKLTELIVGVLAGLIVAIVLAALGLRSRRDLCWN